MSLVGHTIQQYRVLEQLGQGGMAVVYKAYDTRLEREVAIKVIRRADIPESQYERFLKRFEQEARVQARFNHPNIVKVHDYGEHEGAPYLVMEYQPSGTLKSLTGKPMPFGEAARLLAPIADALAYAHEQGVLHRDVKPSNILLSAKGVPLLTDFGIAKLLESEEGYTLTGTGMGVGTPEYMAPEQWKGQAGPQTDIYALGVVLYELVTGRKPYTADTPAAVAIMQAIEPLPLPRQFAADLPEAVEKVILKALALKPEDRYGSMAAFRVALDKLTTDMPAVAPAPKPARPSARPALEPETRDGLNTAALQPVRPSVGLPAWAWVLGVVGVVAVVGLLISQADFDGSGAALIPYQTAPPNNTAASISTPQATSTNLPTPTITPTLGVGSSFINPIDAARLMYVPEGEFIMGSEFGDSDERPILKVNLNAYWMYETEVTNEQFAQFVNETGHSRVGSSPEEALAKHPVVYVNWSDAELYCTWAGVRLPTEAEWEKAARGTDGRVFSWGDSWNSGALNSAERYPESYSFQETAPVGSFGSSSPYRLMDLLGNVWEWVADWYAGDYYKSGLVNNPTGPMTGDYRVLRGGSWAEGKPYWDGNYIELNFHAFRASNRHIGSPELSNDRVGFRCASSTGP